MFYFYRLFIFSTATPKTEHKRLFSPFVLTIILFYPIEILKEKEESTPGCSQTTARGLAGPKTHII